MKRASSLFAAGEARGDDATVSGVGLERDGVTRELIAVAFGVGARASEPVLFVGEEHHPHRASRRTLAHHALRGREHDGDARAVVERAGAEVPRVEVRAEEHQLTREIGARHLAHDVRAVALGQRATPEREPEAQRR